MKIGVCLKQVPDTEARLRLNGDQTWIDEQDLPFVINESDECALEAALQIAEARGGEVFAVSVGPQRAGEALRKALALGVHRAIHLSAPEFHGGDACSNSLALASVMERENPDLVLAGSQSDDVGFGATATMLAERLGWPHAWLVMGIEIEDDAGSVRVVREMESGKNEILRIRLPAVLAVQAGINHPRYASLRGIMSAKRMPIEQVESSELGLKAADLGVAGAPTQVVAVSFPQREDEVDWIEGDASEAARALVEKLDREARVL